jgi:hypothetical protein
MGKEKRKIKRKGISCLDGPGGFRPTWARARARGRACGPAGPAARGRRRGTAPWRGAHTPAREGLTAWTATEGAGGVRSESGRRRNPAAVLRRWSGSTAGRQWRGTGGCRGSRGWG